MRAHEQHGQVASLTAPRKNLSLNNLKIKADMFNKCSTCSMCLWMVHIKMISSNQTLTQVYPHAQSPLTYTPGRTHLDLRMTRLNVGQHVWHLRNTWNTQNTRNWNLLSISQEQVEDIKSQNPWSLRPPHRLSATLPAAEHPKSPSASTYTGEMERHGVDKWTRLIRQEEYTIRPSFRSRIINVSPCHNKGWTRSQVKALELFSQFTAKKSFTKKRQVSAERSEQQLQQYIR